MADEKRQLVLDLLSRNKMTAGTDAAARDIGKVGTAADAAGRKTDQFGKTTVIAGKGAEGLGDSSTEAARKLGKLDTEIDRVNQDLVLLAGQLADADDAAARLDISKGIRKSQAELRRLTGAKGILEALLPDPAPAVKTFTARLGAGLAGSGASIATAAGGAVGPVVGGAIGAAAAPVLISALGAGIAGGAGLGVIGIGIAATVAKDKEIAAAGVAAGKRFTKGLQDAVGDSMAGPVKASLGILSEAGDRLNKDLGRTFSELSGEVVPFTRKVVGAGEAITGSLLGAARESGPAVDALGDSVTLLGDGVSNFIDAVADGGPEAAANLRLIAGATADVVTHTGNLLGFFNKLSNNPWLTGPLLPILRKHYAETADASDDLKGANEAIIPTWVTAAQAVNGQREALVGLSNELRAQADPVFALYNAQNKLRDAQKDAAEATRKHGKNSREAREATAVLATAAIDLQSKVGALGKDFDGKLTPAMRSTLEAAGLTEAQIKGVEREFQSAKNAGEAYAKTYSATTKVYGASAARKQLYSVKDIADSIPRAIDIAMRITGVGNVSAAAAAIRKNQRAAGGPVSRGVPYLVGEDGPEMIVPEAAGRVLSAASTRGAFRGAITPGQQASAVRTATVPAAQAVRVELVGPEEVRVWFRKMVRTMNIIPENTSTVAA
jgi:hypothetical protein